MNVGQIYARPYGSAIAPIPIGNVLELSLEHEEDVQTQEDMTQLGGGVHAEVRRVTAIKTTMKVADINVVNLSRAILGTAQAIAGGTVTESLLIVNVGGLLALKVPGPPRLTLKKGADVATAYAFTTSSDFEVRPEGVFVFAEAAQLQDGDKLWASYTYGRVTPRSKADHQDRRAGADLWWPDEADRANPVLVEILARQPGHYQGADAAGQRLWRAGCRGLGDARPAAHRPGHQQLEIDIKLTKAKADVARAEAEGSIAVANATLVELKAKGSVPAVKEAEINASIRSAQAKLKEADAIRKSAEVTERELSNLRNGANNAGNGISKSMDGARGAVDGVGDAARDAAGAFDAMGASAEEAGNKAEKGLSKADKDSGYRLRTTLGSQRTAGSKYRNSPGHACEWLQARGLAKRWPNTSVAIFVDARRARSLTNE
ncbi:hypothetical protein FQA39_LY18667 [Lamprigera yunnana]|nr:hypothetical protein FQA39_LY18667 [Lamprigera yunnana]